MKGGEHLIASESLLSPPTATLTNCPLVRSQAMFHLQGAGGRNDGSDSSIIPEKNSLEIQEIEMASQEKGLEVLQDLGSPAAVASLTLSPAQIKRIYRKIDFRLMPALMAMQLCCFLDKGECLLS